MTEFSNHVKKLQATRFSKRSTTYSRRMRKLKEASTPWPNSSMPYRYGCGCKGCLGFRTRPRTESMPVTEDVILSDLLLRKIQVLTVFEMAVLNEYSVEASPRM